MNDESEVKQHRLRETDGEATLSESLSRLSKYGGFSLLETTVDGIQNLNPEKKARKEIFLTEDAKKEERTALKNRAKLILDLLESTGPVAELIETADTKLETGQQLVNINLNKALAATKELEKSYRAVNNFYKNAGADKLKNITFLNASPEQVTDLDNPVFIDAVAEELQQNYDRIDLRQNYSIMAIPGFLKSKTVIDKWAKIANKNKVMLVTDFRHMEGPDDVLSLFESSNLTGGDAYLSNIMMTCNWLVGRGRHAEVGEDTDLYVAPSTALAGKIYSTFMSQVVAGKKHGALNEIDGVAFPLKKSEISQLERAGLVPMVNEYGKVMPFSAKTLFNGDNLGLQTYSVVRVFDYVAKVLMDFLNRRAFENFNVNTRLDIQRQIVKFLDSIAGPGKLIEKFKILRFSQDSKQKDRIYLDIHMVPYFPAKNFLIKLDGHKGDDPDSAEWQAEYSQT